MNLEPYGSTLVAFSKRPPPAPKSVPAVASVPAPVDLSTGWTVKFGKDGAAVPMEKLVSWTEFGSNINFSGVATYEKTITVAPEMLKDGLSLSFDFGQGKPTSAAGGRGGMGFHAAYDPPVREAAILYVNNERVASLWAPPYTVDVTGKLKAGENNVRVEVANLAINYMASIKLPNYNYEGSHAEIRQSFPAPEPESGAAPAVRSAWRSSVGGERDDRALDEDSIYAQEDKGENEEPQLTQMNTDLKN